MAGKDSYTVEELVCMMRDGDADAFFEIVRRYEPLALSLCKSYFPESQECFDEALSEANIALFRAARSYNINGEGVTFGLYAKICITNALISKGRRDNRLHEKVYSLDELGCHLAHDDGLVTHEIEDPSEALIRKEEMERLIKLAKSKLSEYEFSAFKLYIGGYSSAEIAKLLCKNEKSVNNAIHRIKDKLRQ